MQSDSRPSGRMNSRREVRVVMVISGESSLNLRSAATLTGCPPSSADRSAARQTSIVFCASNTSIVVVSAAVEDTRNQVVDLVLERMMAHVGRVGHRRADADRRPAAGVGGRLRSARPATGFAAVSSSTVERRVEPLEQVLAQRRAVAHQLHRERVRHHEVGGAGDVAERARLRASGSRRSTSATRSRR